MITEASQVPKMRCAQCGWPLCTCVTSQVNVSDEYDAALGDAAVKRYYEAERKRAAEANLQGKGYKADEDKPDWSLLPLDVVEDSVRVLTVGALKYSPDNWKLVEGARDRYFAAAMRHLTAWQFGELTDRETGLPHLAHASCCLLFLQWFDHQGAK